MMPMMPMLLLPTALVLSRGAHIAVCLAPVCVPAHVALDSATQAQRPDSKKQAAAQPEHGVEERARDGAAARAHQAPAPPLRAGH
eukprot:3421996-Rhodomonas_salina.1